jgi:hypothetical protein
MSTKIAFNQIDGMVVNVKDFGAVGDGVTDDTTPIQSALDSGAKTVLLPSDAVGFRIASPGIDVPSNVTVVQEGSIVITSEILATSYTGAIRLESATESNWVGVTGSVIDISSFPTYNNNLFIVSGCTDCSVENIHIKDANNDRYPLGPIRSQNNSRCNFEKIKITNVGGIAFQEAGSDYSFFKFISTTGGTQSAIETNNGTHNVYIGNICNPTANTNFSAFSFNDQHSSCVGNIITGGKYGMTAGHTGYPASHSSIVGNIVDTPTDFCYNIQATQHTSFVGNIGESGTWGMRASSGSSHCTVVGNVVDNLTGDGFSLGDYYTVVGNIADGFNTSGFRAFADGNTLTVLGNIAMNGTSANSVGYNWGIVPSQDNATIVGNFAGDNQGVATQDKGFSSLSSQNLLLGNTTDGNHVTSEFSGTFSESKNKDLSTSASVVFSLTDTTPSVSSTEDVFKTADATVYTDFDDSRGDGHSFKLLADHAATVSNNSNIKTSTGGNKVLTVGVIYTFTSVGGIWYETATV